MPFVFFPEKKVKDGDKGSFIVNGFPFIFCLVPIKVYLFVCLLVIIYCFQNLTFIFSYWHCQSILKKKLLTFKMIMINDT